MDDKIEDSTITASTRDENDKFNSLKESFLMLKQKICRSHDLIKQYNDKVKECERMKSDLDSTNKEIRRMTCNYNATLAKVIKLEIQNTDFKKKIESLSETIKENQIKIAADQRHIQQLVCKLKDSDEKCTDKVMEFDLEKSLFQAQIKDLEQQLKVTKKSNGVKSKKENKKSCCEENNANDKKSTVDVAVNTISQDIVPVLKPRLLEKSTITDQFSGVNEYESICFKCNEPLKSCCEENNANNKKSTVDVAVNTISQDIVPVLKPCLLEKSTITDQFSGANKYESICFKCNEPLKSYREENNANRNKKSIIDVAVNTISQDIVPVLKPCLLEKSTITDQFSGANKYESICFKCNEPLNFSCESICKLMTYCPPLIERIPSPSNLSPQGLTLSKISHETSNLRLERSLQPIDVVNEHINDSNFINTSIIQTPIITTMENSIIDNNYDKFPTKLSPISNEFNSFPKLMQSLPTINEDKNFDNSTKTVNSLDAFATLQRRVKKLERKIKKQSVRKKEIDHNCYGLLPQSSCCSNNLNSALQLNFAANLWNKLINKNDTEQIDSNIRKRINERKVCKFSTKKIKLKKKKRLYDSSRLSGFWKVESISSNPKRKCWKTDGKKKRYMDYLFNDDSFSDVNELSDKMNDSLSYANSEKSENMDNTNNLNTNDNVSPMCTKLSQSPKIRSKGMSYSVLKSNKTVNKKCSTPTGRNKQISLDRSNDASKSNQIAKEIFQTKADNNSDDLVKSDNENIKVFHNGMQKPKPLESETEYCQRILLSDPLIKSQSLKRTRENTVFNIKSTETIIDENVNNASENINCEYILPKKKQRISRVSKGSNSQNVGMDHVRDKTIYRLTNDITRNEKEFDYDTSKMKGSMNIQNSHNNFNVAHDNNLTNEVDICDDILKINSSVVSEQNNVTAEETIRSFERQNGLSNDVPSNLVTLDTRDVSENFNENRSEGDNNKATEHKIETITESRSDINYFRVNEVSSENNRLIGSNSNWNKNVTSNISLDENEINKCEDVVSEETSYVNNSSHSKLSFHYNPLQLKETKNCTDYTIDNINDRRYTKVTDDNTIKDTTESTISRHIPITAIIRTRKTGDIFKKTDTLDVASPHEDTSKEMESDLKNKAEKSFVIANDGVDRNKGNNSEFKINKVNDTVEMNTVDNEKENNLNFERGKTRIERKFDNTDVKEEMKLETKSNTIYVGTHLTKSVNTNIEGKVLQKTMSVNIGEEKKGVGDSLPRDKSINSPIQLLHDHLKDTSKGKLSLKLRINRNTKICTITDLFVKYQLERLVNTDDWSTFLHWDVINKLTATCNARIIAKCTVDFLCESEQLNQDLDKTYTPPAPMMSKTEQRIVTLSVDLETVEPTIIQLIQAGIEYKIGRLNKAPERYILDSLVRVYTTLARIKKDREKVRILLCDVFYCLGLNAIAAVHTVVTCWPEVIPIYNNSNILSKCLAHFIKTQKADRFPKLNSMQKLLTVYYKYPSLLTNDLLDELLTSLQHGHVNGLNTAIILLAKREGTAWMYKNIVNASLLPMIINKKHYSVYEAFCLLGNLMRTFPIQDNDHTVKNTVEQLYDLITSGEGSHDQQEGIVSALLSLSRHQYLKVAKSVMKWKPSESLRSTTVNQFSAFFKSHSPKYWITFMQKNCSVDIEKQPPEIDDATH